MIKDGCKNKSVLFILLKKNWTFCQSKRIESVVRLWNKSGLH